MLLGVHEQYQGDNATTVADTLNRYPLTAITREFKGGVVKPTNLVPSLISLGTEVWDAGLIVNVSFKLSIAEVFDGSWQIYVEQMCRWLTDNNRVSKTVLTFWHEPEDDSADSYPNGTKKVGLAFKTADEFVRYFNTIHKWVKGVNPELNTSHAALGYGYRPTVGGANDKSAYVNDPSKWATLADINAIDIYSGRSFPLSQTLADSPAFKRWRAAHSGPWAVSERGWTAAPDKHTERAASIKVECEWLYSLPATERPMFYIVWLTEGVENDQALKADQSMTDAINEGFKLLALPPVQPEPDTPAPTEPAPVSDTMSCPLCHGSGTVPKSTYTIVTAHG